MGQYDEMSDAELITALREGDKDVMDYLMEKYKNMVRMRVKSMFILGGEKEDLIQEGMIGLYKAIRDYDPGRDASLSTFCQLVVTRQLYSAVRSSGRQKHMPLNGSLSLSSGSENNQEEPFAEFLSSDDQNPETVLIDRENAERIEEILEKLSPLEKEVLDLHMTGLKNGEIARVLGRDEKSTDNALQRIRAKVRKAL